MRATTPPTALAIAVAACVFLVAAALALLAVPAAASAQRWLRPVPGEVARAFSYASSAPFTAGAHRGVDLHAPPGAGVRAVCAGRVVHAGAVAGRARVVSTTCGARRVSYLPLAALTVRAGESVRAGAEIGTVAAGHGGLHLGVRSEGDRFGYLDPMTLLGDRDRPFVPAPRPAVPRRVRRPTLPRLAPRPAVPHAAPLPSARAPVTVTAASSPAPWPVWLGLALLLCGAAGSGTVAVRRRRFVHARLRMTPTAQRGR